VPLFIKGGEFLLKSIDCEDMFIPEEFSEDVQEISDLVRKFVKKEIEPNINRFEAKDYGFMVKMLKQAGDLGFLGIGVPTEYGGLGLNFNTSTYLGI
jgi:alkylation response protein AidB-like acyl-CoA dehydrogenase